MMRWRMTTSWRRRAAARLAARAARAQRARSDRPPALRIALRTLRLTARALLVIAVMTTTIATVEVLDLWWTRPPTRAAGPVPDDANTYRFCAKCDTSWDWKTDTGIILSPVGRLWEEHHSWVTDIRWARKATDPGPSYFNPLELRLGESKHIDGLGTLTLVEVRPEPLAKRLYRDFASVGIHPSLFSYSPPPGFLIHLEPDPGITIYDCSSPRDGEDEDEECRPVHEP